MHTHTHTCRHARASVCTKTHTHAKLGLSNTEEPPHGVHELVEEAAEGNLVLAGDGEGQVGGGELGEGTQQAVLMLRQAVLLQQLVHQLLVLGLKHAHVMSSAITKGNVMQQYDIVTIQVFFCVVQQLLVLVLKHAHVTSSAVTKGNVMQQYDIITMQFIIFVVQQLLVHGLKHAYVTSSTVVFDCL